MKTLNITLKSSGPLLQESFPTQPAPRVIAGSPDAAITPKEMALASTQRLPTGEFVVPTVAFIAAMRNAYDFLPENSPLRRFNIRKLHIAVQIHGEAAVLLDLETGKPFVDFEVDSRFVRRRCRAGSMTPVMCHRARFDSWQMDLVLRYDETMIEPEDVLTLLRQAGMSVGIGSYRPERGGGFGRFEIMEVAA